jgi:hypothetical protein
VRHLHYAQEEWFYLIEGTKVVIEVGRVAQPLNHHSCGVPHPFALFAKGWEAMMTALGASLSRHPGRE